MKDFITYTLMRGVLFAATFAIVFGVWMLLADEVPIVWAAVIAFLLSGVASYFVLDTPRARLAQRVEGRAQRMTEKFEEQRSKEDVD